MIEPNRRNLVSASLQMSAYGVIGGAVPVLFMGAPWWAPLVAGFVVFLMMLVIGWIFIGYQKVRSR